MAFPKPTQPPTQNEQATVPSPFEPLLCEEFQGINTTVSRLGVDPKNLWWCDGYFPLGKNNLRTLPGTGIILYDIRGTGVDISFFDFANIGPTPYMIVILSDGQVVAVNTDTGVVQQIAATGTIQNPSRQNTAISQWGSQYVIIVSNQLNGYFIWDGTTFFQPGAPAPVSGNMPTALGGTAVETYSGRVWVANGATITFSAPGSVSDFTSGSGGGNFTSTDSFLRVAYIELKQTNGFLYLIGDSSINYISGVQTSGVSPVTTFTNQNADPEVGTPYAATVDVFGRNILFANAFGCHVSYGAAVTKISESLDGFYTSVPNFGGQQLSAAKAIVYGKKVWMVLVPVVDLFTGQQRNKLCIWNGQIWFTSEQDVVLNYIQHQEINSVITAWGSDGGTVRALFGNPSTNFTKTFSSKFWATPTGYQTVKTADRFWGLAQYYQVRSPDVTLTIETENASRSATYTLTPSTENSRMNWTTADGSPMVWTTPPDAMVWSAIGTGIVVWGPQAIAQQGVLIGFTLQTNCSDMAHLSDMLGPSDWSYRG